MMKIKRIWFDSDYLCGESDDGKTYRQSLLWYANLRAANAVAREKYVISNTGIHWRELDEDVSFESFAYTDAEPTEMQRFFLTHREINIAEFAKRIGINASLLRNYINGFKKPSIEREQHIMLEIQKLGQEYLQVAF